MKKIEKGNIVKILYGEGEVMYEDESSMTVVVQYPDKNQRALPRFQVERKEST